MLIKLTVGCKPNGIGHGCIADGFHCFCIDSNKTAGVCGTVQHGKDQHAIVLRGIWLVVGYKSRFAKNKMIKKPNGWNPILHSTYMNVMCTHYNTNFTKDRVPCPRSLLSMKNNV